MKKLSLSRRDLLLSTLFGTSMIGLRSLATGLPAAFLLNPRKALATTCPTPAAAQFIIFSTSGAGDPINANVPGTYDDGHGNPNTFGNGSINGGAPFDGVAHPNDGGNSGLRINPSMATTTVTIGGLTYKTAAPWATLGSALDRTVFFHGMTNTPVHPKEPDVLKLMGATQNNDMLPSILAAQLAPCLNTVQTQPVAVGQDALSFQGAPLPGIPPLALQGALTTPNSPVGGNASANSNLQKLRDQGLNQLYDVYKSEASPAQKAYIDRMATSQSQLRSINQSLLQTLSNIQDNTAPSQIQAAIALVLMKVAPVIAIHIPFGGDNHFDQKLAHESSDTVGVGGRSGVGAITSLLQQLQQNGLQDNVTFMTLNVFGRTLSSSNPANEKGRNHNLAHHVSVIIGKPFKGSVIGGITQVNLSPSLQDFGCTGIDPILGTPSSASKAIAPVATLGALAQTVLAGVGGDPTAITTGSVVKAALA